MSTTATTTTNTTSDRDWSRGNRAALHDLRCGANHRSTWGRDWAAATGAYRDGYAHRFAAGIPA